ncbi:unnamed protein product [Kuraishia capsulata CBS 1993]|uniref:Uncharacterized protein n=1 Tax=Kuraishia capsulata CBS 1993 TaxID=1382522 RepID=W6MI53_9ASCO|nr:unnamed protein product [Kuraishia capsulata CBS 1993]
MAVKLKWPWLGFVVG